MSEVKLVTLKCPSCGGSLSVGASTLTFACEYCGSTVAVERGGDGATLKLLSEGLARVERGTDKVAAEHAIPRITEELRAARKERAAREDARRRGAEFREYALAEAKLKPMRELIRSFVTLVVAWFGGNLGLSILYKILYPNAPPSTGLWQLAIGPGTFVFGIVVAIASVMRRSSRRRATRRSVKAAEEEAARRMVSEDAEFDKQIEELEHRLAAKRRIADA